MNRTDWQRYAACAGLEPEIFFPGQGDSQAVGHATDEAIAICRACPVRELCRAWAINTGQNHGIWGGTPETELRRIQQARRAERRLEAA